MLTNVSDVKLSWCGSAKNIHARRGWKLRECPSHLLFRMFWGSFCFRYCVYARTAPGEQADGGF